jgi:hypothetical protein
LGHGKPIILGAGATPKHVLHASAQVEHRSPAQKSAIRCRWCVQGWHVTCWKAMSVATEGTLSSGPGCVVGEIAEDQAE